MIRSNHHNYKRFYKNIASMSKRKRIDENEERIDENEDNILYSGTLNEAIEKALEEQKVANNKNVLYF